VVELLFEVSLLLDLAAMKATDHWPEFLAIMNNLINRNHHHRRRSSKAIVADYL